MVIKVTVVMILTVVVVVLMTLVVNTFVTVAEEQIWPGNQVNNKLSLWINTVGVTKTDSLVILVVVIFLHNGSLSPYDVTANTQQLYVVLGNRPVIDVLKVLSSLYNTVLK